MTAHLLLEGRRALVTGGSRGIGRAIALGLASAGADVAFSFRKANVEAENVAEGIRSFGRRAMAIRGDLAIPNDVERIADVASTALDGIDVVVHNAGIASRGLDVASTSREEVERVMTVHAIAPHVLTARLLPNLRQNLRSDVIFVSSAEVAAMHANGAPYNMAKSAMEALALTLAKEESRHGIRVNIVAPGLVMTEMGDRLVRAVTGSGSTELDVESMFPFRRACQPDDVAQVIVALLSQLFSYVTGQRIGVDGGIADIDDVLRQ